MHSLALCRVGVSSQISADMHLLIFAIYLNGPVLNGGCLLLLTLNGAMLLENWPLWSDFRGETHFSGKVIRVSGIIITQTYPLLHLCLWNIWNNMPRQGFGTRWSDLRDHISTAQAEAQVRSRCDNSEVKPPPHTKCICLYHQPICYPR